MQVAIDLPDDFVAFQTMTDLKQEVRLSYAIWLYQSGRVTLAKAAELPSKLRNILVHEYMSDVELFLEALLAAREASEIPFNAVAEIEAEAASIGLTGQS